MASYPDKEPKRDFCRATPRQDFISMGNKSQKMNWIMTRYMKNILTGKLSEKLKRCVNIIPYILPVLLLMLLILMMRESCVRRPLEDDDLPMAATISVKIDWSKSGIEVPSRSEESGIHRVSIRFYPKSSKQPVFDCYLEGNVSEGTIKVPVGAYSVVIFNESVDDKGYWEGKINFTEVNDYHNFAANLVPFDAALRAQQYPFYKPQTGEKFNVEPLNLASWSMDNFEVTEKMVLVSQGKKPSSYISAAESEMLTALTQVTMRALSRPLTVTAQVKNLVSVQTNYLAIRGLSSKVYMASGRTTQSPSTYLFTLNGRRYEQNGKDGQTSRTFLCFGRTPAPEAYTITADVLFVSGELYKPSPPLLFDVTNQMTLSDESSININVDINYDLPYVAGGIAVDDWEDKVITLE